MTREIKFRAWDKITEEMVKVSKVNFGDEGLGLTILVDQARQHMYDTPRVNGESCILMQFTGLKDKNGVEIYEGDMVKIKAEGSEWKMKVEIPDFYCLHYEGEIIIEVIGNIYQNPKLLSPSKQ